MIMGAVDQMYRGAVIDYQGASGQGYSFPIEKVGPRRTIDLS